MISTVTWTLPRPPVSKYKGGFPRFFEQNLAQILGYPDAILQPFGGRAELGTRCDLDPTVEPDVVCDAHALPFGDGSYDLVLLDPPYSDEEAATIYGTPKLRPGIYTKEAARVLRPGGWLVIYTDRESPRPAGFNTAMRIVVILRQPHRPRIANVFQKRKPGMPFGGTEDDALEAA